MLWLNNLTNLLIAGGLFVLLLAIIPGARKFSGHVLMVIGVVFFLFLLVRSGIDAYYIGGLFWLIFGLLTAALAIIPIAFICVIVSGEWFALGDIVLTLIFALVPYFLGAWILAKEEEKSQRALR